MLNVLILSLALCQTPDAYSWAKCSAPDQLALYKGERQVGVYDLRKKLYYPLKDRKLGAPEPCPSPLPGEEPVESNYGVDSGKIDKGKRYSKNGKECSRKEALDSVSANVPDDRNLLRLTVIGSDESRKKVLSDLESSQALGQYKGKLLVQDYAPTDWAVKEAGFVTTGSPSIYLQHPSGKVLHRQDDYSSPEQLAEAIRKADGSYKPDADPNLSKPLSIPGVPSDWMKYLPYALVAGAIFLFWRSKKS
jgi:hypothetical protein